MEKLFKDKEDAQRREFEDFLRKNKDNQYLTNLKLIKFKAYQYKELIKLFANNFQNPQFQKSKKSIQQFLVLPGIVIAGFNLFAPFSIFRPIGKYGVFFGCMFSFVYQFHVELDYIARKNKEQLGNIVRYRFQQISAYDGIKMSYKKETEKYMK